MHSILTHAHKKKTELNLNLLQYMGPHFHYKVLVLLFNTILYQGGFSVISKGPQRAPPDQAVAPRQPQSHQPLPHRGCSRAGLQLPTALPCLPMAPTQLGPAQPWPHGGAWCLVCPGAPGARLLVGHWDGPYLALTSVRTH